MSDYQLDIDGHEYQPIPDSWISASPAFDEDGDPEAVRLYATSVAITTGRRALRVRYVHPRHDGVLTLYTGASEGDGGIIPTGLASRSGWIRSVLPTPDQEPDGVIRQEERDHFIHLWRDRLEDLEADGRVAVADGGQSSGDTERCNVCGGDEQDHHLCVEIESVFGGDVWIYDDGYARVVPWLTRHDRFTGGESNGA